MKKILCMLLAVLLLAGCQSDEPMPTAPIDTAPVLVPGQMESGLLVAEPGNYHRSVADGNGDFVEIESGYYYMSSSVLYYADKTNLENWVVVCNDPTCKHIGPNCSAERAFNSIYGRDGRLFFAAGVNDYPHLYDLDEKAVAVGLFSMAYNGQDVRLEHFTEKSIAAKSQYGGSSAIVLYENSYIFFTDAFEPDGSFTPRITRVDLETGEVTVLFERNEEREYPTAHLVYSGNSWKGINGDPVLVTGFEQLDYNRWFYWFHEGKAIPVDGENIPSRGGYLSGNILRIYKTDDGYYDLDLLTGAETRLADAQLTNASARIIQPNCIIEWNDQQMRLFDGQQWREITLPAEVLSSMEDYSLWPMALCSDRILFRSSRLGVQDSRPKLYSVMLTEGALNMEYAGRMSLRMF